MQWEQSASIKMVSSCFYLHSIIAITLFLSLFMQVVVKIQPQTFKSSYIKLIVLLWSLVYSLLFAIFAFIRTREPAYIASLTVFIIFGVVYLITAIAYILIRNARKDCDCFKMIWFVDTAYFIGGILYYVGRNFPFLATVYICSVTGPIFCRQSMQTTQSILLGTAVVFYRFIPYFISKYYQSNLVKEHQTTEAKLQLVPEWILAAESLTLLVEFDALYTIMIPLNRCIDVSIIGAWVLWTFFILVYIFILYFTMNIQYCGNCNVNKSCVTSNFGAIVALAAFGMYLLANNVVPILCTGASVIAWIFIKILVLIVVITAIVLLLVYRCLSKTRQEKLLPRALYQHLHPDREEQNNVPLETDVDDEEKKEPNA